MLIFPERARRSATLIRWNVVNKSETLERSRRRAILSDRFLESLSTRRCVLRITLSLCADDYESTAEFNIAGLRVSRTIMKLLYEADVADSTRRAVDRYVYLGTRRSDNVPAIEMPERCNTIDLLSAGNTFHSIKYRIQRSYPPLKINRVLLPRDRTRADGNANLRSPLRGGGGGRGGCITRGDDIKKIPGSLPFNFYLARQRHSVPPLAQAPTFHVLDYCAKQLSKGAFPCGTALARSRARCLPLRGTIGGMIDSRATLSSVTRGASEILHAVRSSVN